MPHPHGFMLIRGTPAHPYFLILATNQAEDTGIFMTMEIGMDAATGTAVDIIKAVTAAAVIEVVSPRASIGRQDLRIPDNFPNVAVRVLKVPCVSAPKRFLRPFYNHSACFLRLFHYGIHLSS